MASFTQVSFSTSALEDQIKMAINRALDDTIKEVKTWKYFEDAEVEDLGTFHKRISSNDLKAWIYYMGTGNYMDKRNSKLGSYIGGDYWNESRPKEIGADIVRRGKVKYTSPDWEKGSGTITRTGADPAGSFVSRGVEPQDDFYALIKRAGDIFIEKARENLRKINVSLVITSSKEYF